MNLSALAGLLLCAYVVGNARAFNQKFVDLTHAFDENTLAYPITEHPVTFGLTTRTYYPNGLKVTAELYHGSTSAGTHIGTPAHYVPGAKNIDQFPLDQLVGAAAVIDIASKASLDPEAEVTVEDLMHWEDFTGHSLDDTIVFMRSGWGAKYGNKTAYFGTPENDPNKLHFPGIAPQAAQWLVDNRRIKGTGVDTPSTTKGTSTKAESQKIIFEMGLYVIENVANLENIPISGATVYILPMKITGATAAPIRVIATYPEMDANNTD